MEIVRRTLNLSFYLLLFSAMLSALLTALNVIVYTGFHFVAMVLAILTVLFSAVKGDRSGRGFIKNLLFYALLIAVILMADFITVLLNPRERQTQYISPGGTNTIIMAYDFVSRPILYRKHNAMMMTSIPFSIGAGYTETVNHRVVWLSETKIQLEDDDGQTWIVEL